MRGRLAIGVGCRGGIAADAVCRLVRSACSAAGRSLDGGTLFTHDAKRGEGGLLHAAERLGLPMAFLPQHALEAVMPRILTPSRAAQERFGIASVAEAAALAGAGKGGRLLGPRLAQDGVTCALAATDLET